MNLVCSRLNFFTKLSLFSVALCTVISCGGGGGDSQDNSGSNGANNIIPSNRIRLMQNCDLSGLNGVMDMEIEALGDFEFVFGSGPNPDITGFDQIGVTYLTSGTIVSPTAEYIFSGENEFADVTRLDVIDRFRIQWVESTEGLSFIVNPFGEGPTLTNCETTSIEYL